MNYKGGYALISMAGIVLESDNSVTLSKQKLREFTDALKSKKRVVLTDLEDEDGNIYNACEWTLIYDGDIYLVNESTSYKIYIEISSRKLSIESSEIENVLGAISSLSRDKIDVVNGAEPSNVITGDAWVDNKLVITGETALTLTELQETNLLSQLRKILSKRYVKKGSLYLFLNAYADDEDEIYAVFGYSEFSNETEYMLKLQYSRTAKEYYLREYEL